MQAFLCIFMGYGIGSICFGLIFSYIFKLNDPRSFGSKSIGATNILRSGHKLAALLTLIFDAAKGFFAVFLAFYFYHSDEIAAITGVFALIGHCFPVWLGFKGGKGVATGVGVLVAFSPLLAVFSIMMWFIMTAIFRISSLSALVATLSSCILGFFIPLSPVIHGAVFIIMLLIIWRHHTNIKRLLQGCEPKMVFSRR